jgi:hypothetical protein
LYHIIPAREKLFEKVSIRVRNYLQDSFLIVIAA